MADCGLPRPLLDAWLAGGGSPDDTARVEAHLPTCEACRVLSDQASLGVGLLLLADGGGAAPSPGFTDRVMASVRVEGRRAEGRRAEGPRAGVDDDGPPATPKPLPAPVRGLPRAGVDDDAPPPPPQRPLPPRGRLLGLPRPAWAGVAAALAAGAAWMVLLRDPGTTVVPPGPGPNIVEKGKGSVAARDGGVLRWTGHFDGSLAGSVWVAKDGAVPTYAGELLHSPAPSSFLALLPEGGRLEAGPSSWLAVGGPGEAALLEGGFTVTADAGRPLELETPAGRVTVPAGGEVEVSVGAAAGGPGTTWLGLWAAARRDGVDPGRPLPPPPPAAQVIFARRGAVEFAAGGGPVRNTLERTSLKEGQALVILESKAFLATGVDDDGPPDSSRWMDGLPVPPGSRFFRRPVKGTPKPETPPGGFGAASGPVRNTLERSLGGGSTPAERAYALSVYESVGGVEAVAAAAKAAAAPAGEVRCAALRVLALTASADRETALAALRKLAGDEDAFVARFAILALKTLRDEGAVEVLRAIAVDDDAPPDTPKRGVDDDAPPGRIVAKVYALDALVALGDRSLLKEGAALLPEAEKDPVLYPVLRQFVYDAMEKLPREELRAYYADPRPGVKAAALLALQDFDLAEEALRSESETVRLAGALVLLEGKHPSALEKVGAVDWASAKTRAEIIRFGEPVLAKNPAIDTPTWMRSFAQEALSATGQQPAVIFSAIRILDRDGAGQSTQFTSASGNPDALAAAILSQSRGLPFTALRTPLLSNAPQVRYAALFATVRRTQQGAPSDEVSEIVATLRTFECASQRESSLVAVILLNAAKSHNIPDALDGLLDLSRSQRNFDRLAAATILGFVHGSDSECIRLLELLDDTDSKVAARSALTIATMIKSSEWRGHSIHSLYPSPSSYPLVRIYLTIPAVLSGLPGSDDALLNELLSCSSGPRLSGLQAMQRLGAILPVCSPLLLQDPDPAVRITSLLLSAKAPTILQECHATLNDPNLWVRAVACALLINSGDNSVQDQLQSIVGHLSTGPAYSARLLQDFDATSEVVLTAVSLAAEQSISDGVTSQASASDDSRTKYASHLLLNSGISARAALLLAQDPDAETRSTLLRRLATSPCVESISMVGSQLPDGLPGESRSSDEVVTAYSQLLGFTPSRADRLFHSMHWNGYVTATEVLAGE